LVRPVADHPIVADLPWEERPPGIGGFNRFRPRAEATVLLEVDRLTVRRSGSGWETAVKSTHPLLAVSRYGKGRTAALATDVAPHWVGGLVDWGPGRVTAAAEGADGIEVGDLYARFLRQLIDWCRSIT